MGGKHTKLSSSTHAKSDDIGDEWISFMNLSIHNGFFKKGIIVVSPRPEQEQPAIEPAIESETCFQIKNRTFEFASFTDTNSPRDRHVRLKIKHLFDELIQFAQKKSAASVGDKTNPPLVLVNKKRREEVFFPLIFTLGDKQQGLYLNPWTSHRFSGPFNGFKRFVSAGCLFGANLQAITNDGLKIPLINHEVQLKKGQIIERITLETEKNNPFELVQFSEFEKTCVLINLFSQTGERWLIYHLPVLDYMLFGINLYIHQCISEKALNVFFYHLFLKEKEYHHRLKTLAEAHGIKITINSPFDNLIKMKKDAPFTLTSFLTQLHLKEDTLTEQTLVKQCIDLLTTHTIAPVHQQIWQDFIAIKPCETLEDLFHVANTILLAEASKESLPFETCSVLPLSEKQIPIEYNQLLKSWHKIEDKPLPYTETFNLTLFEPVITYSAATTGLLFYFSAYLKSLAELFLKQPMMNIAAGNISKLGFYRPAEEEEQEPSSPIVDLTTLVLSPR